MSTTRDSLSDLERHTQLLEANVAKLTQGLGHWRLLEAEYEALSEEVAEATAADDGDGNGDGDGGRDSDSGSDSGSDSHVVNDKRDSDVLSHEQQTNLVRIRRDFDGQLVDQKTVSEIFGARPGQTITKKPSQIRGVIDRRLDYVRQNAATLQKQVEREANRLAAAQVISRPDAIGGEESGEPITDIVEELDEDGNVLNVRLQTPSNTQARVLETLEKAGIHDLAEGGPEEEQPLPASATNVTGASVEAPKDAASTSNKVKKGVSFTDDTKPGHGKSSSSTASAASTVTSQPQMSRAAQRLEDIMRTAKEQESMLSTETSVASIDESEDDAALRREMLEYSMSEIGPIVAQLDIEEASSGEDEEDEGYDDEYDDDDDDEEDGHGRSKYSAIDEAYRQRMLDLERKLGVARSEDAASSVPAGVDEEEEEEDVFGEGIGRIIVSGMDAAPLPGSSQPVAAPASSSLKGKSKEKGEKKKVSFASSLDISSAEVAPAAPIPPSATGRQETRKAEDSQPLVEPLGDVVERSGGSSSSSSSIKSVSAPEPAAPARKPSRFKMARGAEPDSSNGDRGAGAVAAPQLPQGPHQAPARFLDQDRRVTPEGPEGQTMANAIVERQLTVEAREPDELDATLLMQEAATEYHRSRNRLIQRQGGFMHANDSGIVPLDEEEGGPKRVSRFRAARLSKQ